MPQLTISGPALIDIAQELGIDFTLTPLGLKTKQALARSLLSACRRRLAKRDRLIFFLAYGINTAGLERHNRVSIGRIMSLGSSTVGEALLKNIEILKHSRLRVIFQRAKEHTDMYAGTLLEFDQAITVWPKRRRA